jgi:uncharacterized membrane protein YsdA (DUF1294 family)
VLRAILLWLAFINVVTYGVYWLDKRRAEKGKWRISEKELLLWAAIGGSPAAFFAMRRFRHKTRKTSFRVWFWLIVVAQLAAIVFLLRSQV